MGDIVVVIVMDVRVELVEEDWLTDDMVVVVVMNVKVKVVGED